MSYTYLVHAESSVSVSYGFRDVPMKVFIPFKSDVKLDLEELQNQAIRAVGLAVNKDKTRTTNVAKTVALLERPLTEDDWMLLWKLGGQLAPFTD